MPPSIYLVSAAKKNAFLGLHTAYKKILLHRLVRMNNVFSEGYFWKRN